MVKVEGEQRQSLRPDLPRIRRWIPDQVQEPTTLELEDPEIAGAVEALMQAGPEDTQKAIQEVRKLIPQDASSQKSRRSFFQRLITAFKKTPD